MDVLEESLGAQNYTHLLFRLDQQDEKFLDARPLPVVPRTEVEKDIQQRMARNGKKNLIFHFFALKFLHINAFYGGCIWIEKKI